MLGFFDKAPFSRLFFALAVAVLLTGSAVFAAAPDEGWYPIGPPGGEAAYIQADYQNQGTLYVVNPVAGVFKSTDAGDHWFGVNSGLPVGSVYFGPLVIDPFVAQTLYVGTTNTSYVGGAGVYRTTDGGVNWTRTCAAPIRVGQILPDPKQTGVVYVSGSYRPGSFQERTVLWRTADRGETCEGVGLPYDIWNTGLRIAVDSADPDTLHLLISALGGNSVYFYYRGTSGGPWTESALPDPKVRVFLTSTRLPGLVLLATSQGLYRSVDSGANWTHVPGIAEAEVTKLIENRGTGAFYLIQGGIFVSRDTGATWTRLTADVPADLEVLEADPFDGQTLYAGTKQGVFKSTDEGTSWQPASYGFDTRTVAQLFPHPTVPGRVYATAESTSTRWVVCDGCPLNRTDDNGGHWKLLSLSNAKAVRFSPDDPSLVYAWTSQGVWTSKDAGDTWVESNTGLPASFPYQGDLEVDPRNHAHLYLTLGAVGDSPPALYRSTNGGESWEKLGPIPASAGPFMLGVMPTGSPLLLLGGYWSSFLSRDGGLTWAPIPASGSSLLIAPSDPKIVYIGAYRSDDSGEHWLRIAKSVSAVDWFDPMLVYSGVFRSRDGGASWDYYGQGADGLLLISNAADPREPGAAYSGALGYGAYRRVPPSGVTLYFPYLAEDSSSFTGFAVGNLANGANRIDFTAYSSSGGLLALEENPAGQVLEADQQLAKLGREIFSDGEAQSVNGWIAAKSESDAGGFFLFAGDGEADGALAETSAADPLIFSRVLQGTGSFLGQKAETTIVLANPTALPSAVSLSLCGDDGQTVKTVERTVPARGRLEESAASLFGAENPIKSGYILVKNGPVVGFELVELPDKGAAFGLNALRKISLGKAWSAQLANVPGMKTRIKLINTFSNTPIKAVLTAVSESGQPLADAVEVEIPKNGALERDVADLFKFDTSKPVVGSLTVTADSSGLVGDVVFGDLETFRLIAALPLQTEAFREALFSQVANGMGYYNGLALYNPADQPNAVRITVRNADGQVTGEATLTMPPGARLAKLLPELVPSTAGQIRGTIRITSSLPVVAQELFGTDEFLAAVPAWPVSR